MHKPQSGDRVEPGAASAPGFAELKQTKSPFGATEIGRSRESLPLITFHHRWGGGETNIDSTRSPRWGFLFVFVHFILGRRRPRLYSVAALRLRTGEAERIDQKMSLSQSRIVANFENLQQSVSLTHPQNAATMGTTGFTVVGKSVLFGRMIKL